MQFTVIQYLFKMRPMQNAFSFLDIHESNFFLTSDYGEIILRFLVLTTHELMCDNRFEALTCLYVINLCPLI